MSADHDVSEHERAVLATLLLDRDAFLEHAPFLDPEEFTGPFRRAAAEAMRDLHRSSLPLDSISLRAAVQRHGYPCQLHEIADLLDAAVARPNVQHHLDLIHAAHLEHRARAVAMSILREENPISAERAADELRSVSDTLSGRGWGAFATGADSYHTLPIERPPSLVGRGLVSRGDLGILYGEGGKGKSYLALQLAYSIATGADWVGLEGPEEPMRVGVVAMEVPRHVMLDRITAVCGGPGPAGLRCIAKGDMPLPNLSQATAQRGLISWIRRDRLDLVVLDAMSRFWGGGDELKDAASRMAICEAITLQTGAAILWIHHERKNPGGKDAGNDDDMAALRSSTIYQTHPTVLLRLTLDKGLTVLRCAKTNFAAIPEPVYLMRNPDGTLRPVEGPREKADRSRDRILEILNDNPTGISPQRLIQISGYARATVYRHLKRLGAEQVGTETSPVYRLSLTASHMPGETGANPHEQQQNAEF